MKEASFKDSVHRVVQSIPKGKTMSYGEVAKMAGSPGAARAVGTLMAQNYDPTIPCHRVIQANGKLGQYNRINITKWDMLEAEGCDMSKLKK